MISISNQKGVGLIELLVSIAILGLLGSSTAVSISAFIRVTGSGNDKLTAFHEIQNASYWISRDGQMASSTDLVDGASPVNSVSLTWTDKFNETQVNHSSAYSLSGTILQRTYDSVVRQVARNISDIQFSLNGQMMTVVITSAPQGSAGVSEQRTYTIRLRPIIS
ncbi:MAG: type II secretion system protein [Dehalococcoidia bacterium]